MEENSVPDVGKLSAFEVNRKFERGERIILLDVREDDERVYCSINLPQTIVDLHIPMRQVPARLEEIQRHDAPCVVYCHHGVRSMAVAQWLANQGSHGVFNLEGGIDAWSVEIDPNVARY